MAEVTIDQGAVCVAICDCGEWRCARASLATVWTEAAGHLRRDHGDLTAGRKATTAARSARLRAHRPYRLPHGIAQHTPRRGDDDSGRVTRGAVRESVGVAKPPRALRPTDRRAKRPHP